MKKAEMCSILGHRVCVQPTPRANDVYIQNKYTCTRLTLAKGIYYTRTLLSTAKVVFKEVK